MRGNAAPCKLGAYGMNLPIIELASLPDLGTLTGVFGSLVDSAKVQSSDDTIIAIMTFLYDVFPPSDDKKALIDEISGLL